MKKPLPSRLADAATERLLPGASSWRAARSNDGGGGGVHAIQCLVWW